MGFGGVGAHVGCLCVWEGGGGRGGGVVRYSPLYHPQPYPQCYSLKASTMMLLPLSLPCYCQACLATAGPAMLLPGLPCYCPACHATAGPALLLPPHTCTAASTMVVVFPVPGGPYSR